MLNGKEWQHSLSDFLIEAQTLLAKSEECLCHLELFANDKDAIECLLGTLLTLTHKADALSLGEIAGFSRRIRRLLKLGYPHTNLQGEALCALKRCFTLLAWQLELIDADTGMLLLDDEEQLELLNEFAGIAGLEGRLERFAPRKSWTTALQLTSDAAPEGLDPSRFA